MEGSSSKESYEAQAQASAGVRRALMGILYTAEQGTSAQRLGAIRHPIGVRSAEWLHDIAPEREDTRDVEYSMLASGPCAWFHACNGFR